jgi:hypothetical protein
VCVVRKELLELGETLGERKLAGHGQILQVGGKCVNRISMVRSTNPGYCYKAAGWTVDRVVRGKLYLWAPERAA